MSDRYALIDADGRVVNVVIWDGETEVEFGHGLTAHPMTEEIIERMQAQQDGDAGE